MTGTLSTPEFQQPSGSAIHIPKHANLCTFTLTRVSPYDMAPAEDGEAREGIDLTFEIHPALADWLQGQATQAMDVGKHSSIYMEGGHTTRDYTVEARDEYSTNAFNLSASPIVHRSDTPSLRFTESWYHSLSFLRYTTSARRRALRFTPRSGRHRTHAELWHLTTCAWDKPAVSLSDAEGEQPQIPWLELHLRTAFRALRDQHIVMPVTRTTTIQIG